MFQAFIVLALVIAAGVAGAFVVMVLGIRHEDTRNSVTGRAPNPGAAGTRRILGLTVDHTGCHYATNERHTEANCPVCREKSAP
ncbi:hypothetical protein [Nonomuraea sp. NPDC046570]|uniref:hypothetical protein n=1 Tax=Nonomuraea sp. NPDC046570 TaxID=3155255 RepID=UPI0034061FBD